MTSRIALGALTLVLLFATAGCSTPDETVTTSSEAQSTLAASDAPEAILTLADVESVTGLSGLSLDAAEADPATGASADITVVDQAGTRVLTVWLGTTEDWEAWLTDGYSVSESVVPPVGDESFVGPNPDVSGQLSIFALRKGEKALLVETAPDANGEYALTVEQLRGLAELAVARL